MLCAILQLLRLTGLDKLLAVRLHSLTLHSLLWLCFYPACAPNARKSRTRALIHFMPLCTHRNCERRKAWILFTLTLRLKFGEPLSILTMDNRLFVVDKIVFTRSTNCGHLPMHYCSLVVIACLSLLRSSSLHLLLTPFLGSEW